MKTRGDLVSFIREEYHKYKDGGFQYETKYILACQQGKLMKCMPTRKTDEMHMAYLQLT